MIKHLLSRRQFNASCAAFGLSLPTMSAMVAVKGSARVLVDSQEQDQPRLRWRSRLKCDRPPLGPAARVSPAGFGRSATAH